MLLTYVILTYNQKEYIRTALASALAQTYAPLEILVADDGSQDGTWEALQEEAAAYRGPHTLRLHRNERNLGIVRNLEKAFSLASGDLIVKADGDDLSAPTRAARLAEAWEASGRQALVLAHGTTLIDTVGKVIGHRGWPFKRENTLSDHDILWGKPRHYQANSCAYRRSLFTDFPPVKFGGAVDDLLLTLRAIALGGGAAIRHLPDELTLYRMGSGRTNDYSERRRTVCRTYNMILNAFRQFEVDLAHLEERMEAARHRNFVRWTREAIAFYEAVAGLYGEAALKNRLRHFRRLGCRGLLSLRLPLYLKMLLTAPR